MASDDNMVTLRTRAHPHETAPTASDTFDHQLRALSRTLAGVRSSVRKMRWRAASQKRTTRIASVLRSTVTLVSHRAVRTKYVGGWHVTLNGELVFIVVVPGARTVEQLLQPIEVEVHRPGLVNRERLEQYERNGVIQVTIHGQERLS